MAELKPCPFCGSEAKFMVEYGYKTINSRGWEFAIKCTKCGTSTPKTDYRVECDLTGAGAISIVEDDRREAIEAWNRRCEND